VHSETIYKVVHWAEVTACESERVVLNGTSAQSGYTVPFTLIHAGKCRTEDKDRHNNTLQNLKHNPEKQTTQNTAEQNYRGSVTSYDTRPGKLPSPEPTRVLKLQQ